MIANKHPSPEQLELFSQGKLDADSLNEIAEHINHCDTCCQHLEHHRADTLINLARTANLTPEPTHQEVPTQLIDHPRYRVQALIGAGGMGMVYRAEHRMMGREVALKVMSPRLLSNSKAIDRFHREVRAAAKLNHPNIVTAHDADEANGLHFLVMEYVEGQSLDRYVARKGPLPVQQACHFIRQAALGLAHAHQHQMVHRDIKPHNLMVNRKGQLKILDFGLARVREMPADDADQDVPPLVTAASMVLGTPDYLSPEQAKSSSAIDGRSDLYSLGCTFYFLLTGQPPFAKAATVLDKLLAHTEEPAGAIRQLRADVPVEVEQIISKLMQKKPDDRYSNANELVTALTSYIKNIEATVPLPELARPSPSADIDDQPEIVAEPTPPDVPLAKRARKRRKPKSTVPIWLVSISCGIAILLPLLYFTVTRDREGSKTGKNDSKQTVANNNQRPIATSSPMVLFVLPSNGLWNSDYLPVRQRLEQAGIQVRATSTTNVARLMPDPRNSGSDVTVDLLINNAKLADYQAIIFAGYNVTPYIQDPRTVQLVNEFVKNRKVIAAICGGIQVLARLNFLDGKSASRSELGSKGVTNPRINWQANNVVTDGLTVTAASGDDAIQFADALIQVLRAK